MKEGYKVLYGVGVIDDPSILNIRETTCLFYKRWSGVIQRCYSDVWWERHPSCVGNSVCSEWLYLSEFSKWMKTQQWQGLQLDKDLLVKGNRHYSPDTCVFIPKYINLFVTKCSVKPNGLPTGVKITKRVNRVLYEARIGQKYLGTYVTPEEAHRVWQKAKAKSFDPLIEKYKLEDSYQKRVEEALVFRKLCIISDYENGTQTTHI